MLEMILFCALCGAPSHSLPDAPKPQIAEKQFYFAMSMWPLRRSLTVSQRRGYSVEDAKKAIRFLGGIHLTPESLDFSHWHSPQVQAPPTWSNATDSITDGRGICGS